MGHLNNQAKAMVAQVLRGVGIDDRKLLNRILRKTYREHYCVVVDKGDTHSGYKAWRRQVRRQLGLERKPKRRSQKRDEEQMDMFLDELKQCLTGSGCGDQELDSHH